MSETQEFRRSLLNWYGKNARDLPWRRTRDPYAILVSEVMLQQTQVATVISYYNRWLERLPDFESLASASENDVLHAWQGLGYYRRARHLHAAAKTVAGRHGGKLSCDPTEIRKLPGIGRYTANAVACFAFDRSVPVVETNIARVLSRVFDYRQPIDSSAGRDSLWRLAATLLPRSGGRVFNSALMELGALVCRATPQCRVCPVQRFCRAPRPEALPRKRLRSNLKHLTESHAWVRRHSRILLQQSTERWRNMWILPPLPAASTSGRAIYLSSFPFTHHRIQLRVFRRRSPGSNRPGQRWFAARRLASIPIPSPHRRAIDTLLARTSSRRN